MNAYEQDTQAMDAYSNAVTTAAEPIAEPRDLQRVVRSHAVGGKVIITFVRGGRQRKVTVVL